MALVARTKWARLGPRRPKRAIGRESVKLLGWKGKLMMGIRLAVKKGSLAKRE